MEALERKSRGRWSMAAFIAMSLVAFMLWLGGGFLFGWPDPVPDEGGFE